MDLIEKNKQALKRMGKSISLISCADENGRYVSPSSAVTNLSYDPPTFLLPLEKSASLYPLLANGTAFAVNILGAGQEALVDACVKLKGEERFSVGNWTNSDQGPPILSDAQASFICQFEQVSEYQSHGIIVGRVVEVNAAEQSSPLIYVNGGFSVI